MTLSTKRRKFLTYMPLTMALRKSGVKAPGKVATLLLEAFVLHDGRIIASHVYSKNICEEKQFREWRRELIEKSWLTWTEVQLDKGLYYPGKKLIPYINKEKAEIKIIATQDSVENLRVDLKRDIDTKADKSELQDLKAKMNEIAEAVQNLQKASTPPDDDAKKKMREESTAKLVKLASVN